jgi:hypothetical protein
MHGNWPKIENLQRTAMANHLSIPRWLIGSALGAIVAAFLIGLLGMLTKVILTGNAVAYFASIAGAILSIAVAGPGCWLTLAIVFRLVAKRNLTAERPITYARAGILWGLAHSIFAILLCALMMAGSLTSLAYAASLLTGTAVTAAMIYLPPAPDHVFILAVPVGAGWIAGLIFGSMNRNRGRSVKRTGGSGDALSLATL